ncbi:NUDIX domain-containing protein [Micromonospora sp. NPDC003944]
MQFARRVGAYGLLRDAGRVFLVRDGVEGEFPEVWRLPGGVVGHAEDPAQAVVREVADQAGLTVTVTRLFAVVADVATCLDGEVSLHTDRLLFELGTPRDARSETQWSESPPSTSPPSTSLSSTSPPSTSLPSRWLSLEEVAQLPLTPFTSEALGLPVTPLAPGTHRFREPFPPPHPDRRLRFGAYGLVTDPAGRILLTQIATGYPGAGLWHLPGGGTDHGEQPATGLLRELVEEGGQVGRVVELLGVNNLHNPAAVGPEGRPLDWHGVRVIYRVVVDVPTDAVVTESAGGSTARAGWFSRAETVDLPLSDIAAVAIGQSGR